MMKMLGAALAIVLATVACQPAPPPAPTARDADDGDDIFMASSRCGSSTVAPADGARQ